MGPARVGGPPRTDRIRIWSAYPLVVREEGFEVPWRGPGVGSKGPVPSIQSRIIITPRPASRCRHTAALMREQPPNGGRTRGNAAPPSGPGLLTPSQPAEDGLGRLGGGPLVGGRAAQRRGDGPTELLRPGHAARADLLGKHAFEHHTHLGAGD